MQVQREREKTSKLTKVNNIRKRIKEIGHDAVSNSVEEDDQVSSLPSSLLSLTVPVPKMSADGVKPKIMPNIARAKTGNRPRNEKEPQKVINAVKEEELMSKLEKIKSKKKKNWLKLLVN